MALIEHNYLPKELNEIIMPNKEEIIQQEPIKTEDLNKIEPAITFADSNHYSNKQSN